MSLIEKEFLAEECGEDESKVYNSFPVDDYVDLNLLKDECGIKLQVIGGGNGYEVHFTPRDLCNIETVGRILYYLSKQINEGD